MKSKKLTAAMLALLVCAAMTGCGQIESSSRSGNEAQEQETVVTEAEISEAEEDSSEETAEESSLAEEESSEDESEEEISQEAESSEEQEDPSEDEGSEVNNDEDPSNLADFDIDVNEDGTVTEYYSQGMLSVPIEDMQAEMLKGNGIVSCDIVGPNMSGYMVLKTTFTPEGYEAYSAEKKAGCKESLDEMFLINRFNAVTSVSYNDDFTDFYIYVSDADTFFNGTGSGEYFDGRDKENCYSLIETPMTIYHVYNLDEDDVTITMHFIDSSGNEFLTDVFDDEDRSAFARRDE